LYTSGTTAKPKGVVTTHANIQAQAESLIRAWEWSAADHILHVLPLHHVHGILAALHGALLAGATCEFLPRFDAVQIWRRLAGGGGGTTRMVRQSGGVAPDGLRFSGAAGGYP